MTPEQRIANVRGGTYLCEYVDDVAHAACDKTAAWEVRTDFDDPETGPAWEFYCDDHLSKRSDSEQSWERQS